MKLVMVANSEPHEVKLYMNTCIAYVVFLLVSIHFTPFSEWGCALAIALFIP